MFATSDLCDPAMPLNYSLSRATSATTGPASGHDFETRTTSTFNTLANENEPSDTTMDFVAAFFVQTKAITREKSANVIKNTAVDWNTHQLQRFRDTRADDNRGVSNTPHCERRRTREQLAHGIKNTAVNWNNHQGQHDGAWHLHTARRATCG